MASKDKHLHFFPLCGQIRVYIAKKEKKRKEKKESIYCFTSHKRKKEKKVSIAIIYNPAQNDK